MPIISVIIPVYNAEKSLDTCLQSIVEQSVGDLEIICVDDGSTDGSYEKLVGWRKKDGRIKVLRQENKGGGAARNLGLAKAAGEYIHFLDSDDSLQPQAYETMYEEICRTRSDVCFCQYYNIDVSAERKRRPISSGVVPKLSIRALFASGIMKTSFFTVRLYHGTNCTGVLFKKTETFV